MPKSELLTQILSDYCASIAVSSSAAAELQQFCDFAANWLVEKGCAGLGHAATGLTLRFADGAMFSLFSADDVPGVQFLPVAISGTKEKLQVKAADTANPSVNITGR